MRKAYQRRLPSDTSKDYYFIHRNTGITEPIIIEYGFLDTLNDANRLKNNYKDYAEAVVRAVSQYIGLDNKNTYVVSKGDSLYSIAKKFSVSVESLKAANDLSSNLLNIGQTLKIPVIEEPLTGNYTVYTVKSGDNLYSIAKKYNTTTSDLINYNNLSTSSLSIGQRILIPVETLENNEINNYDTYIVKSGDSLYSIARKYNTNVNELMNINNLSSNLLSIGQKILVPKSGIVYTVKSGDSLYSIARNYNTTVDSIKQKNNLNSNLLSIGQILQI